LPDGAATAECGLNKLAHDFWPGAATGVSAVTLCPPTKCSASGPNASFGGGVTVVTVGAGISAQDKGDFTSVGLFRGFSKEKYSIRSISIKVMFRKK
jgi:hypothetical protein